jgi:hypothetical protein
MNESEDEEEDTDEEAEWKCAACELNFENEEACFIHLESVTRATRP